MTETIDAKATLEREILALADQIERGASQPPAPAHQAAIYHRNTLLAALAIVDAIDNVAQEIDGVVQWLRQNI